MFAICFDMTVADVNKHYGKPYNSAYYVIRKSLEKDGFYWVQGSTLMTMSDDMGDVFKAIMHLKQIPWFCKAVRDIRGFRVEQWSNFTDIVRNE